MNREIKKLNGDKIKENLPAAGLVVVILLFTALTGGRMIAPANLLLIMKQSAMQIIAC